MSLGNNIYELRSARGMSQGKLAELLDVSRQSVSKWETESAVPDLDKLIKMCDLFDVTLDTLTGRTPKESRQDTFTSVTRSAPPFTTANIVGYILLAVSLIAGALIFVIDVDSFLMSFPFLLPILACGIICLCVKRNIGYWCVWAALSPLCVMTFYFLGLPILSTTGGTQIIVFIIMSAFAYKKVKGGSIQISKKRTIVLAAIAFLCLALFIAIKFMELNFISFCIVNYSVYAVFALMLTYGACYVRALREK